MACPHEFDTEEARTEDGVWMSCSLCGQRADTMTPLPKKEPKPEPRKR